MPAAPQPRRTSLWHRLTDVAERLFSSRGRPAGSPERKSADSADLRAIAESGLFDATFYRIQETLARADDKPAPDDPLRLIAHYLRRGAREWLNPSRHFDTGYYTESNPELAQRAENPLLHYIRIGRALGRPTVADAETWRPGDVPSAPWPLPVEREGHIYVVPAYTADRNTTRYRVRHLVELVGEEALRVVEWQNPPDDFFPDLESGARVILQRLPLSAETEAFVHRVRTAARVLAYDIDDQVFDPNELEDWRLAGLAAPPAQYARCMALADHFVVSTTALRAKVERRFGRPAHVVTNVLGRETMARSRGIPPRIATERFVIGYASGSHTHDEDLAIALPAIRRFLQANPDATFHCIGRMSFPKELVAEFGDRVRHQKPVRWHELPPALAQFTVQIVPLTDCPFNRCKSHIRFLEAAAVGVPSIVSRVGEPATSVLDGVTGLACDNDVEAWVAALQALHDDPSLRVRMADAGRQFVDRFLTTDAPFARDRALATFEDLQLGILRDRIGVVVANSDPAKTLADLSETMTLPWSAYVPHAVPDTAANVLAVDSGRDTFALTGLATERFLAVVGEGPLSPLWDLRMLQAAKAMPQPGWLSADGAAAGGAVTSLSAGIAVVRGGRGGGGPFMFPASAQSVLAGSVSNGDGTFPPATTPPGVFTGVVPVAAARGAAEHSIAIKVCTPVAANENAWGDTHYARGLARALAQVGYGTRIDKREEWYGPHQRASVAIHLFGTAKYKPDPAMLNILWVISHPEALDAEFLRGFDMIYYAVGSISPHLRELASGRPIEPLLQCTDTDIFFPDRTVARDLDVVFIGNSRKVNRDAVRYAVEGGFDLALWGTLWEPFVDRRIIRGTSLRPEEVASIYRRARVVLNDHWADQKTEGLVNNRIFDALACGAMVLSDANPGLDALLGGAIPTFADGADFSLKLRALLDDPELERRAAALGAEVRRDHTFAQRARVIHDAIVRLRAERPTA